MADEKLVQTIKEVRKKTSSPYMLPGVLIKVIQNTSQRTVTVEMMGAEKTESILYLEAELNFVYEYNILEIHSDGKYVCMLQLPMTIVFFI